MLSSYVAHREREEVEKNHRSFVRWLLLLPSLSLCFHGKERRRGALWKFCSGGGGTSSSLTTVLCFLPLLLLLWLLHLHIHWIHHHPWLLFFFFSLSELGAKRVSGRLDANIHRERQRQCVCTCSTYSNVVQRSLSLSYFQSVLSEVSPAPGGRRRGLPVLVQL